MEAFLYWLFAAPLWVVIIIYLGLAFGFAWMLRNGIRGMVKSEVERRRRTR